MSKLSKEVLRNYIKEQNFTSADEVLSAMKEMFRDILQEALESEMDTHLGYDENGELPIFVIMVSVLVFSYIWNTIT